MEALPPEALAMDVSLGPVILVIGAALLLFIGLGIPTRRADAAGRAVPRGERSSLARDRPDRT